MRFARTFGLLTIAAGLLAAGDALACSANEAKLQTLRRGMTYAETVQVMGCQGRMLTGMRPQSGAFSTIEWIGSELPGISYTEVDFQDDRLVSFTSGRLKGL